MAGIWWHSVPLATGRAEQRMRARMQAVNNDSLISRSPQHRLRILLMLMLHDMLAASRPRLRSPAPLRIYSRNRMSTGSSRATTQRSLLCLFADRTINDRPLRSTSDGVPRVRYQTHRRNARTERRDRSDALDIIRATIRGNANERSPRNGSIAPNQVWDPIGDSLLFRF
jgi:hypothetical protein